nr:hypothetical protein [uncultured bacterium]
MKDATGFTLIELLVVIAIIGILSTVVLASLNSARSKSRDARRLSDLKQFQLALALYYDTNREYPDALSKIAPGLIASVPNDPSGQPYLYSAIQANDAACTNEATQNCVSYVIGATNFEGVVPPDPNTTIGSVPCANPTYCVRP